LVFLPCSCLLSSSFLKLTHGGNALLLSEAKKQVIAFNTIAYRLECKDQEATITQSDSCNFLKKNFRYFLFGGVLRNVILSNQGMGSKATMLREQPHQGCHHEERSDVMIS
jgi:hypothetical protein